MFEFCSIIKRECGYCCSDKQNTQYCGLATGENRLKFVKKCPQKPKKRGRKTGVFK
jgi:hypothetical protein